MNNQNHQIKVTLTEENYNKLKQSAEKNYRTISQEINFRLSQLLSRPGGLDAPLTSPIYYPPGVRSIPSPENPDGSYTITATAGLAQPVQKSQSHPKSITFTNTPKINQDRRVKSLQSFYISSLNKTIIYPPNYILLLFYQKSQQFFYFYPFYLFYYVSTRVLLH